jgi:hypothetical protein
MGRRILWYCAWTAAGFALSLGLLAPVGVGIPMLAAGMVAAAAIAVFGARWPEPLGALSGAGLACLLVAFRTSQTSICLADSGGMIGPGDFYCGGSDPLPWGVAGLALLLAGLFGYRLARAGRRPVPRDR